MAKRTIRPVTEMDDFLFYRFLDLHNEALYCASPHWPPAENRDRNDAWIDAIRSFQNCRVRIRTDVLIRMCRFIKANHTGEL